MSITSRGKSRVSTKSVERELDRTQIRGQPLLVWKVKDGLDPSVHFVITKSGVLRLTGRGWRVAREAAKGLGSIMVLVGLITGRISFGPYALSQHYFGQESEDKQSMRWRDVSEVTVNKDKHIISLFGRGKVEMQIRCTPETFESALNIVKERAKSNQIENI